jgi:hypothetical protein
MQNLLGYTAAKNGRRWRKPYVADAEVELDVDVMWPGIAAVTVHPKFYADNKAYRLGHDAKTLTDSR